MSDIKIENKVVVNIFGEDYPITGVDDPEYITQIAKYVDSRMKEIAEISRAKARDKVAILAALSLASELHEKKANLNDISHVHNERYDALIQRLDQALADTNKTTG